MFSYMPIRQVALTNWWSTSGFLIYMGKNLIYWTNKEQHNIAKSSTESEYQVLMNTWDKDNLALFTFQRGFILPSPSKLWCDNLDATYLFADPIVHARIKHIEVDFHFVHDLVGKQKLMVKFLSIVDHIVKIFTKFLHIVRFKFLRDKLRLCLYLEGDAKDVACVSHCLNFKITNCNLYSSNVALSHCILFTMYVCIPRFINESQFWFFPNYLLFLSPL